MSLYQKDDPQSLEHLARWRVAGDKAQVKLDAEERERDPLAFYWRRGCRVLRDTFAKPLNFNPKPEQFYNEGK